MSPRLDRYGDALDGDPEPDASTIDLTVLDHGVLGCDGTVTACVGVTCALIACDSCGARALVPLTSPSTPTDTPNTTNREDTR